MATIEIADLGSVKMSHVNVTYPVGRGQRNEKNDVMAIQALFKLVGNSDLHAGIFFGLSARDLPDITGRFDEKTNRAILALQRKMSSRLLSADGMIHPASYRNRILQNALNGARLMVITWLNLEAVIQAGWIASGGAVPDAVKILAPTIRLT
jgi:hypothetical protein